MVVVNLPYGNGSLPLSLPDTAMIAEPIDLPGLSDARVAVREALAHPIGSARLRELASGKRTATIVINDITRPAPSQLMVEELLVELAAAGIDEAAITLLVAAGNHRPNTAAELEQMLGTDLCRRLRVVNHDCVDPAGLVLIGETPRGIPVQVNRLVVEADLTILTGIITPHQTAGYSGGRKSIMPGVAGAASLRIHHSHPIRSLQPIMGRIENNAFHQESVAAARLVGVDFIVNVVKNNRGQLVAAVAGDLEAAHLAGVAHCNRAWRVTLDQPADIAVVSPGNYPKDIDLHQAQKAVASAELITRAGGPIILVAECRDGIGKFASAFDRARGPQDVVDDFLAGGFRTENHTSKAYMYARAMLDHPLFVVTDRLDPEELERLFIRWAPTPAAALEQALEFTGVDPCVVAVPHAVDCILSLAPGVATGKPSIDQVAAHELSMSDEQTIGRS